MIKEAVFSKAPAELRKFVIHYCLAEFNPGSYDGSKANRCVPSGMAELIFHLNDAHCYSADSDKNIIFPGGYIVGVMEYPVLWKIPPSGKMFSVRIKPEYISDIIGLSIAETKNTFIDLELLRDPDLNRLKDKLSVAANLIEMGNLFSDFLKKRLANQKRCDDYLVRALEDIRASMGRKAINDVSRDNYICRRQLERRFISALGYSPKAYSKIIRFSSVIESMQKPQRNHEAWHEFIYKHGYSDQAHFIKEFREYAGSTPGEFYREA